MIRAEPVLPPGGTEPALRSGFADSLLVRYQWLAFAIITLTFLASFNGHWRIGQDSATFRGIARNLVRSHQYVFLQKPPSRFTARRVEKQEIVYPGMPLLLAAVQEIFGEGDLAPHLVMLGLAVLTLGLVYRFFKGTLGVWVAAAVTFVLGMNRVFLEHTNELLSDLPFLLGVMTSLFGFEMLRRAAFTRQWLVACAVSVFGLGLAVSMRPTFWILTLAWIAACLWGLIRPEPSALGRRRKPYLVALGLLVVMALTAIALDPRTHGMRLLTGGYEDRVRHQLDDWQKLVDGFWERTEKTLDEHIATCIFAFAVKHSSTVAARVVMAVYSLMVIGAGTALIRVNRLWGLLVVGSAVSLSILGDNPRYYLMILPLLLAGWCLFCLPIARWLGPDRPMGNPLANRLFGWAPRHWALPRLAMLWGLGIVMFPNFARDLDLVREQRGLDRTLHYRGFTEAYAEGKAAGVLRVAEMVKRSAPQTARVLGPEPTILTYLSDRQVSDLDRVTGRWGRGWRQGLAAMNFQLAVFPPGKAAELYGDRDLVVNYLFDRRVLMCTRELDHTLDGAKLCEFTTRYMPGEHVRGSRTTRYRTRRRRVAAVTRPAG